MEKNNKYLKIKDLNIIGKSYSNNTFKSKIAESFSIRDTRPTLNTDGKSVPLNLFNWYVCCVANFYVKFVNMPMKGFCFKWFLD